MGTFSRSFFGTFGTCVPRQGGKGMRTGFTKKSSAFWYYSPMLLDFVASDNPKQIIPFQEVARCFISSSSKVNSEGLHSITKTTHVKKYEHPLAGLGRNESAAEPGAAAFSFPKFGAGSAQSRSHSKPWSGGSLNRSTYMMTLMEVFEQFRLSQLWKKRKRI